jgi:hypothetical protein
MKYIKKYESRVNKIYYLISTKDLMESLRNINKRYYLTDNGEFKNLEDSYVFEIDIVGKLTSRGAKRC